MHVVVLIGHQISWSGLNQLKSEVFYTGHIGDRGYSSVTTKCPV